MSEYNKYFLLYLTTNAQSRLELTDNYIQTYNYSIDEATTKAEGRCWHYVKLIENENSYILVRHDEIKIVKVKFVGSSGFEGISRTNGNRKPVWAMITA